MSTNYGNPYLYPGYNMIKVDLQIKQEFIKKRQMTFEEALDVALIVLNEKNATNYTINDAKGLSRKRELVEIRHCVGYILTTRKIGTLKSIGRFFGGRDHSTVINGNKKWQDLMDCYPSYRRCTNEVLSIIE